MRGMHERDGALFYHVPLWVSREASICFPVWHKISTFSDKLPNVGEKQHKMTKNRTNMAQNDGVA